MEWTDLHGRLLGRAFERVLGRAESGTVAFVRCLTPDVVAELVADSAFAPQDWQVSRVADSEDAEARTITADTAVEERERKGDAVLLLVDTDRAGAGMDGIYSAAREVDETSLFREARRLAAAKVTRRLSSEHRRYAEQAIRKAAGFGSRYSVSPWTEFDFLCRIAAHSRHPGACLHLLGLWPVAASEGANPADELGFSRWLVEHLLGASGSGLTIPARIESLRLVQLADDRRRDLERFLHAAETRPLLDALAGLADKEHLWAGVLQVEAAREIQAIELVSWRNRNGRVAKWSGLVEESEGESENAPPVLVLKPKAESSGDYSKLEIKWRVRPGNLEKNAADYRITVLTGMDELVSREVGHSGRKEEKCRFSNDDFSSLDEDSLVSARVVVAVVGNDTVRSEPSEEFIIRFGEPPDPTAGGAGKPVRTFSEGLSELDEREQVSAIVDNPASTTQAKDFVLLRTLEGRRRKSFRVFRPPLIHEVEKQWTGGAGAIGRWRVKVRASGDWAGEVEFVPFEDAKGPAWTRTASASRRMAQRFGDGGGVAQIYDDRSKTFDVVREYVLAWTALLDRGDPSLALCNTVEVQSLSGRTIGLIVLPVHPLRVAWHTAYDSLVLYAAFDEEQPPKKVLNELRGLDGAMFPAFLPNPDPDIGGTCVFADTLGFHAVGMVPDHDKEPKAALAILTRALGEKNSSSTAPTLGGQSAPLLGDEIVKYLDCHDASRLLRVHALRAGDGLTIARALGHVHRHYRPSTDEEDPVAEAAGHSDEEPRTTTPSFSLELYPSSGQRGIAGRFIAEAREKRRSGSGVLSPEDRWMLESTSLPGGVNMPRLRWARKNGEDPETAAHLAVAFDTFESQVLAEDWPEEGKPRRSGPFRAFGLLSFYQRDYTDTPTPLWRSTVPQAGEGERHPSERGHSERLERLQRAIQAAVARNAGVGNGRPVLRTAVSPAKAHSLETLHRLCDWVVTLDRNAGIEYFDSPRDNRAVYDKYVIDCVPEREDLGSLQLITSTSNLEEVCNLLDETLDQMGLSRSRRNAEFLLSHLKSLSGRLAMRLTGNRPPTSELLALAVSHANCRTASEDDDCWVSLDRGFIVPVDDVRDLLPPLQVGNGDGDEATQARPDLVYVTTIPRKGLVFRFIEVKYRRHLRAARTPEVLRKIHEQTASLHRRWYEWYSHEEVCASFRAVRRARLARVLRFYADKAHRHHLPAPRHKELASEIDRMIEKGGDYALQTMPDGNRGWVFCPEYAGPRPLEISPAGWSTRIFLFGPGLLPDSDFRNATVMGPSGPSATKQAGGSAAGQDDDERLDGGPAPSHRTADVTAQPTVETPGSFSGGTEDAAGDATDPPPSVCLGTDSLTSAEVRWPLTTKGNPHLLIAGLPGMGKTTCLLNLCRQMVAANVRPIVFSYHQDIDERLEQSVDSVRFIDFGGLGFNPLEVVDRESRMAHLDVAGAIRDVFAAIYPELGDIQADRIRRAVKDSFIEAGWSDPDIARPDLREPPFRRFVEILRSDPKPDRGLRTLLARLEELEDYRFFELDESHRSLWESDRPTVIRIHTTRNDNLQRAFASLVFYGLYKDMFRRGIQERITHALIFDEAHRAAGLTLIPTMAKECRKYGISLVLASQEARDFHVSVFSAISSYLVLRLTETDARTLVRNVAGSQQERMLTDEIKQMARFKALYFREGEGRPSRVDLSA